MFILDPTAVKELKNQANLKPVDAIRDGYYEDVNYAVQILKGSKKGTWYLFETKDEFQTLARGMREAIFNGLNYLIQYELANPASLVPLKDIENIDDYLQDCGVTPLSKWLKNADIDWCIYGVAQSEYASKASAWVWCTSPNQPFKAIKERIYTFLYKKMYFNAVMKWDVFLEEFGNEISPDIIRMWVVYFTNWIATSLYRTYDFVTIREMAKEEENY